MAWPIKELSAGGVLASWADAYASLPFLCIVRKESVVLDGALCTLIVADIRVEDMCRDLSLQSDRSPMVDLPFAHVICTNLTFII